MTKASSGSDHPKVKLIILKAQKGASSRTQNRIVENGPSFFQLDESIPTQTGTRLDGRPCILVRSASQARDWMGWLPLDEIHFVNSL